MDFPGLKKWGRESGCWEGIYFAMGIEEMAYESLNTNNFSNKHLSW
jgi:hypothetical protein